MKVFENPQRGAVEGYRVLIAVTIALVVALAIAAIIFFSLRTIMPQSPAPFNQTGTTNNQADGGQTTPIDYSTDTDGDGTSDYVEKLSGTNPQSAEQPAPAPEVTPVDYTTDTDGDGTSDYIETLSGTDPNTPGQ